MANITEKYGLCPKCTNQPKISENWCKECKYGLCPECNQPKDFINWCRECNSKRFQQNFGNWTSGNEHIDKFIQDAQLNASSYFELLEWIPYNRLKNIKFLAKGGFSTVYEGIWLEMDKILGL